MGIGFPLFCAACDISLDLWEWQWLHGWNLMKFEEGGKAVRDKTQIHAEIWSGLFTLTQSVTSSKVIHCPLNAVLQVLHDLHCQLGKNGRTGGTST